jgi:hypothetical protein
VATFAAWQRERFEEAWRFGTDHREALVGRLMARSGRRERPLLKEIIDEVIEEEQGARLLKQVLPLDTYAQTELVGGRAVVTVNSRIPEMPGVKDAAGARHVALWHESVHIPRDILPAAQAAAGAQATLPGFEVDVPRVVVCKTRKPLGPAERAREFFAENAAQAAAIAAADLQRCGAYAEYQRRLARGGDLGRYGWALLYGIAAFIGVNITALCGYFEQRGLHRVEEVHGRRRLVASPQLIGWESTADLL